MCVYKHEWLKQAHIPPFSHSKWLEWAVTDHRWKRCGLKKQRRGGRVSKTHALCTHTRDHKHSREGDISVPDAAAGALSGRRNIQALGAGGKEQGSICGTLVGLRSLELLGPEINAMGNSNSKKKTQANLTSSHRTTRVKSIWHFRHVDKFKTGRKNCIFQLQSVYMLHILNYSSLGDQRKKCNLKKNLICHWKSDIDRLLMWYAATLMVIIQSLIYNVYTFPTNHGSANALRWRCYSVITQISTKKY